MDTRFDVDSHHCRLITQDWNTECCLSVRDSTGQMLGMRDPFWPAGIPASKRARQRRIIDCARSIINASKTVDARK